MGGEGKGRENGKTWKKGENGTSEIKGEKGVHGEQDGKIEKIRK